MKRLLKRLFQCAIELGAWIRKIFLVRDLQDLGNKASTKLIAYHIEFRSNGLYNCVSMNLEQRKEILGVKRYYKRNRCVKYR